MAREQKTYTALEAKFEAQKLAFAPFYFQAVVCMRDLGVLDTVFKYRKGINIADIAQQTGISIYGIKVLVEAGLCIEVFSEVEGDRYKLTKIGRFLRNDEMTKVNINFTNDVCYHGLANLKESIVNGKPEGLKVFGNWPTIYEGLAELPEKVKQSWFEFDHFYSDEVFENALKIVFQEPVKNMFDIGGNTGKWAKAACTYNKEVELRLLDLPGQLNVAKNAIAAEDYAARVHYHEINLLDESQKIPKGADAVWMSQFLDCFSMVEIISILKRVCEAVDKNAFVYILEPFYNNQTFAASEYCLVGTSLYFTAMANGNSKMYHKEVMLQMALEAGLELVEQYELIGGTYHTLLKLRKK